MSITAVAPQLRTRDLSSTIHFYTEKLGFVLDFRFENAYAGVRTGAYLIHLKQIDEIDPSAAFVEEGGHMHLYFDTTGVTAFAERLKTLGVPLVRDVHDTPWNTKEFVVQDDQGHTLYFGESK
jgi:catechol 2,3-dioxygenase-like lactoylglutathione lyase family enzyme